jgi:hypothetical protein
MQVDVLVEVLVVVGVLVEVACRRPRPRRHTAGCSTAAA